MQATDREAIKELISKWAYSYDEERLDLMADCFTGDATLEQRRPDVALQPLVGRDAILASMRSSFASRSDRRRHFTTNTWFESEGEDSATAVSFLVVVRVAENTPSVFLTGIYRDEVVRQDRWRIYRRIVTFDNAFPSAFAPSRT